MHHSPRAQPGDANAYASLQDPALMTLVQAGNHDAFAELVSRHTSSMLSLATRTLGSVADAEDTVQTVFIKLWQRPDQWQADRSLFSTWLYRVVLNACYDVSRARTRRSNLDTHQGEEAQSPDVFEQISEADLHSHRQHLLTSAMSSLSQPQQAAIDLAVFAGLPQKQVADILGVSIKAVESLLVRAKQKLRQTIDVTQRQVCDDER